MKYQHAPQAATTLIAGLAAMIPLCGCVHPVPPPPSKVAVPPKFVEQVSAGGAVVSGQDLGSWWTVWHEPELDALINEALEANTDIRTAQANVAAARAMTTVAESALYPSVFAQGSAWGSEADWRTPTIPLPIGSSSTISHGGYGSLAGLGASWEPDVFGRNRADVAAARAVAASTVHSLHGARVTVVADVAENYHEARGLQLRIDVLDRGIETMRTWFASNWICSVPSVPLCSRSSRRAGADWPCSAASRPKWR
jgi:outer membrane protein TolC